ncbi:MAG: NAD(P)/FAD-dependent oxidoreductase [Oscillospiraceae bacterium]|nr:NAD(P)/FAD-dependent oxidoreductase [Ruminococcus sp.]MDD7338269.1 NAD(P)/FAD-dependent oxidoreductase [Ruminococcus sp.]MDY6060768.1 NAD(P)/FAD-dependent oxidoreductase [Oscillospiraceae bacterium]
MSDVLIIGGGAAGLMAAGTVSMTGKSVTVLERNDRPARKVMITGKGRCNVTNNCTELDKLIENVPQNGRFLYSAFSNFMPSDTMELFEDMGVPLKTERGGRVFPVSDKAVDIVDALVSFATDDGAQIVKGRAKELIIENGTVKGAVTYDGEKIFAEKVLIATGGKSYPATGSTGDGYELAKQAGHTVTELKPSLVSLVCHEGFCTDLQGLALKNVSMSVIDSVTNKEIYKDFGEMLFTHFGVSGPMILSAGAHMRNMQRGRYKIYVDMKPGLSYEQLDARILRDFSENNNKNFINSLGGLLPRKMIPVAVKLSGIKPTEKVNQITKEQRHKFAEVLKKFKITVNDFSPIEEAIVTSGGVKVSEIDPKTMESKIVKNLYFAGEVIDVDAYTGGFNLQIAFSTGRLAGENM